ncbi:MAG TPA: hypothetical protein DCP90_07880 [Clostridiales bacterium]|nr:MAG: hypothetical protein A2Y22_06075 [Clostridiales bacterium GWD2_32_59]HAN10518.1 hypothetical protein [Clostridiales bacterium]
MENVLWRIADLMRGYMRNEDTTHAIYTMVLYKLLADFKREAEYLREPHRIMNLTTGIEIERLKNSVYDIKRGFEMQMREIDVARKGIESIRNLPEDTFKEVFYYLDTIDFTKEIARGNYQLVAESFLKAQETIFSRTRSMNECTTPENIISILKGIMNVKGSESILDICAGTGRLLIDVGIKANRLIGQEMDGVCAEMAEINMIVANKDGEIIQSDSLIGRNNRIADVVVCHPPFGKKGFQEHYQFNNYLRWGQPAKTNLDFNFLSLVVSQMGDRGAVVVPEGVLFRGGADGEIRERMIRENLIEGIIALPSGILNPSMSVPASLLILKKDRKTKDIFMFDAKSYFKPIRGGVTMSEENLKEIVSTYDEKIITDTSRFVGLKEIEENGYVLTVNRYMISETKENDEKVSVDELIETLKTLENDMVCSKEKTDEILKKIKN